MSIQPMTMQPMFFQQQQQQQQQQQSVTIVNQPGGGGGKGQPQNVREWGSGIFGCCEDVNGCIYCFFCYPCFTCSMAAQSDECCLGPICCYPWFLYSLRTKVRAQYGIKGSICKDCVCMTFCERCATHQVYRELKSNHV